MAEQQKENSSAEPKLKSSLLDEEIGKEFLSSWKSMSMVDDDTMDFSFDTVSKGKKKTFNFEKLDMDFNLDGEFDKISSFKVDMSDLDFSCPPKNPAKSMEKNDGESSGEKEGKEDSFNFKFDFNALDSFNLDSSLIKGDPTSNKNLNKKGVVSDGSNHEGAENPEPSEAESVRASHDSMAIRSLGSERQDTSKVETLVANPADLGSTEDSFILNFSSSGNLDVSIGGLTPSHMSKKLSTEELVQEKELPEKMKLTESKFLQSQNPPSQSVVQNESKQDNISEQHSEVCSPGTKVITGSKNVNDNKAYSEACYGEKSQLENSSPLHISELESNDGEAVKLGWSIQAEATKDLHLAKSDTSYKDNTQTGVSKKISCENYPTENQKSNLECHLAPASSEAVVDEMMLMKDKEVQAMQLKLFSSPDENCPLKHQASTAGTKGSSFGCQKIGDLHLRSKTVARHIFSSNDTKHYSKLVPNSISAASEPIQEKLVLLNGKDNAKKSNDACSLVNSSSLTENTARQAIQMSIKPQADVSAKESVQKSRITSTEGNKLSSIKVARITPTLSSLKNSRNIAANKVLTTSMHQKETNSSVNSEQNVGIQGIAVSKNDHHSAENQKPSTLFLKRKSIEVSEADLVSFRSPKRLSQSPTSRNSKECSEKVDEQVYLNECQGKSEPNNFLYTNPTSGLESPTEISLTEVKTPDSVLLEDNGNVEKAEAYTKELEDICNMLKKKHEEAKELLVRAIVNNNNLLMLNHPIYEDKIRKVQKRASQLMSKGIET